MKREEFFNQLANLKYNIEMEEDAIYIYDDIDMYNEVLVAKISDNEIGMVDTKWSGFEKLSTDKKSELFKLISEYIITPVENRNEDKKYYIKHPHLSAKDNCLNYNTEVEDSSHWFFSDEISTPYCKTSFTLKELPDWVNVLLEQGHMYKERV